MDPSTDRATGTLIGLAVGEALGGGGVATAMARNLAASLVAHDGALDADDVTRRQLAWLATDPSGLDPLTRIVLTDRAAGVPDAAERFLRERGPEVSAGNGAVRSCAPLGVADARHPGRLPAQAPALAALTHADGRCATSCLAVTSTVAALVRGVDPEIAVRAAIASCLDRKGGEELEFLVGEAGRSRPLDGPDRSFTLFAAGIGLQVAGEGRAVEDGLHHVLALRGDAAANGAVAGALLGAAHGASAIPSVWLARIGDRDGVTSEARALAALA